MKAIRFLGNGRLELADVPRPTPVGDEVLVRVRVCAMCSTDVRYRFLAPDPLPVIPGHEIAGDVIDVDRPQYVKPGERVALTVHAPCGGCEPCRRGDGAFCENLSKYGSLRDGGNAEYVLAKETSCLPLPDDFTFDDGALIGDTLGTAWHGVGKLNLLPREKVLVVGGGPIGLACARIAIWLGAEVTLAEIGAHRIALARALNIPRIVNPNTDDLPAAVAEITAGRGFDHVAECGGNEATFQAALDAARVGGKVVLLSMVKSAPISPAAVVCPKELTIMGSWNFNSREYRQIVRFYRANRDIVNLITHRFPLARAEDAYALFMSGKTGKVVFQP
ncbi:MAG: alcohol dehydrogenase catalytic domain-containing protein [Kiritimatiellae bacterium]|nr:alcohol dehydrogenase catalytic domain-containing protein [Kiritimatiellia bacterium]